jgi:hypothetical protein
VITDDGRNHREYKEEQRAEKDVLDAKDHKDEIEDEDLIQVYSIGIERNPPNHSVEMLIG